jgi:hypothetical protein
MPASRAMACPEPLELAQALRGMIEPGDVILVKGSRALALERVIEALKNHCDSPGAAGDNASAAQGQKIPAAAA